MIAVQDLENVQKELDEMGVDYIAGTLDMTYKQKVNLH